MASEFIRTFFPYLDGIFFFTKFKRILELNKWLHKREGVKSDIK